MGAGGATFLHSAPQYVTKTVKKQKLSEMMCEFSVDCGFFDLKRELGNDVGLAPVT